MPEERDRDDHAPERRNDDGEGDKEQDRGHRPGEQHQPEHSVDQGADEVMPEERDSEEEGRTNVDVHEPRDDRARPRRGQALRPRERDEEAKEEEPEDAQ
jgi:hypothetical protein